jgi:cold shock CspA family protein
MSKVFGRVNWFDSKKGFGFVTVITPDNEYTGKDIFLHFSNLNIEGNYKRVFPGEYVEFSIETTNDNRQSCSEVTGINGGPLLVENENHQYKIYPKNRHHNLDGGAEADAAEADAADAAEADAEAEQ